VQNAMGTGVGQMKDVTGKQRMGKKRKQVYMQAQWFFSDPKPN
jgi:hypothetical protein